jgi:hypothetical protein
LKYNPYRKQRKRRNRRIRPTPFQRLRTIFHARTAERDPGRGEAPESLFEAKAVYLDSYRTRQRPAWLGPVIIAATVLLVVFWTGPYLLGILTGRDGNDPTGTDAPERKYDTPDYAVVARPMADLLLEPDLRSPRLSQVLYNDLLRILDRDYEGFYQVALEDGTLGYIISENVHPDAVSAEPGLYDHKLMVVAASKRIMSHAGKGSLLQEVYMGSVLYADYQGDGIYRVVLPGGDAGWISSEGVVRTDPEESPVVSNARKFYETTLSFVNTTYVDNGLTIRGASSSGIAYISARINGIRIPRAMDLQFQAGTEVPLEYHEETGEVLFDRFRGGDLVFFRNELADPDGVSAMGIVVGPGQLLMSVRSKSTMRLVTLTEGSDLVQAIVGVRRLFDTP